MKETVWVAVSIVWWVLRLFWTFIFRQLQLDGLWNGIDNIPRGFFYPSRDFFHHFFLFFFLAPWDIFIGTILAISFSFQCWIFHPIFFLRFLLPFSCFSFSFPICDFFYFWFFYEFFQFLKFQISICNNFKLLYL